MLTSRSLTEVFILMRNNAVQSRHIFADSAVNISGRTNEDRLSLVPLSDADVESGRGGGHSSRIPPEWVNMVDEVQYEMTRIQTRIKDLCDVQNRHVMHPNFDDADSEEQRAIKRGTEEVTSMLAHCQRLVMHIRKAGGQTSSDERLLDNVVGALVYAIQQLTLDFRASQTGYLKQLQRREEDYQQYFSSFHAESPSAAHIPHLDQMIDQVIAAGAQGEDKPALTMAQIQSIEDSVAVVEEREREILQITKSIVELNQMFKDVAQMVVEQGTIIDRIDYNVEQSSIKVKAALQSVKKAEQYQKKNRKMIIIITLIGILGVLLLLLILRKSL